MQNIDKGKAQTLYELKELRRKVAKLEAANLKCALTETIVKLHADILKKLVKGDSMKDVLLELTQRVDQMFPKLRSSILLMQPDAQHLKPFVGPHIPVGWSNFIDPLKIGPKAGSCGAAAYLKKRVITKDITNDPFWHSCKEQALSFRFRACWSEPIMSRDDKVLGTFAMYFSEPRLPSDAETHFIETIAALTAMVIQHKRAENALQKSEYCLRQAQHLAHIGHWEWNMTTKSFYWSDETFRILGRTPNDFHPTLEAFESTIHPDDRDKSIAKHKQVLLEKQDTDFEHRIVLPDGTIRHVQERIKTIRSNHGNVVSVLGTIQDITEHKESEQQRIKSLKEKEVLLRELYHRTKNNMQVIVSLLTLQTASIRDAQLNAIIEDTKNRIKSMALVHEKLYQSKNLSVIDLKDYVETIAENLLKSYHSPKKPIKLVVDGDSVPVTIDTATSCGLVANELVSNSLKYAFPRNEKGRVIIRLASASEGQIELKIGDDGIGLPPEFDFKNTKTLGFQLVVGIVEKQLRGKIRYESNDKGHCFYIKLRDLGDKRV